MANPSPALNPNPPKLVTGVQIKAGRALLGWRRVDLAAAAGLHPNSVSIWERRQRMPRREPSACRKMRAALLSAGVVTVSTPAPGVCLLDPGRRTRLPATAEPRFVAPNTEGDGQRFQTPSNGAELCTMHNGGTVFTAQEQAGRSPAPDGDQDPATSVVRG